MKEIFADNIKRLRLQAVMTQEELAGKLGVVAQTVSKWENAESYPDVELLPKIANLFGVTVDELLGNDVVNREKRICYYEEEFVSLLCSNDTYARAFDIAYKAYEEFPREHRIMLLYANALNVLEPFKHNEEIKKSCDTVMSETKIRNYYLVASTLINGPCTAEEKLAFLDNFIRYGECWAWFDRYDFDSDEGKILIQHEMFDKWWSLNSFICDYGNLWDQPGRKIRADEKIKLIEKSQKIFYAYFDKDDLGEFTFFEGQYNEFLAKNYAALGMKDKALDALERSADGWERYLGLPKEYSYKGVLYDHRPYNYCRIESGLDEYLDTLLKDLKTSSDFNFIRKEKQFIAAVHRIESLIENTK